jgi:TPR repeat protein
MRAALILTFFTTIISALGHTQLSGVDTLPNIEDLKKQASNPFASEVQYDLACRYKDGHGVPKSDAKAYILFVRSAVEGNKKAAYKLAMAMFNGEGVNPSKADGYAWMLVASDNGIASSSSETMKNSLNEKEVKDARINADEIERSLRGDHSQNQLAFDLMTMHRPKNDTYLDEEISSFEKNPTPEGMREFFGKEDPERLRLHCENTNSVDNLKELLNSANKGDANAQWILGDLYFNKGGTPYYINESLRWYRMSAEQGDASRQYELGRQFIFRDENEYLKWINKSANQGFAKAENELGLYYAVESNENYNATTAVQWFKKAVMHGVTEFEGFIGYLYYNGKGVPKDQIEGLAWAYLGFADNRPTSRIADEYNKEQILEWEKTLGPEGTLKAQERAKVLKLEFDSKNK